MAEGRIETQMLISATPPDATKRGDPLSAADVSTPYNEVFRPNAQEIMDLADTASRSGDPVVVNSFNKLLDLWAGDEKVAQFYASQGVDLQSHRLNSIPREAALMNYESLRRDPPFDADLGGLGAIKQVVFPDAPKEGSTEPVSPPTWSAVTGPGMKAPDIFPMYLIGQDGHGGAAIPPDLRAALGSLPDEHDIYDSFEQILEADARNLPQDDDLSVGVATVLQDVLRQRDDLQGALSPAAEPDGLWAERFGVTMQNFGNFLAGDFSAKLGDPIADEKRISSETAPIADFRPSQFFKLLGSKIRANARRMGSNVSLSEPVGDQTSGARGAGLAAKRPVTIGRQQAMEYRAHLHDLSRNGQLGFSKGFINSIPERELIKQLERFNAMAADFGREAAVQSGQFWMDLAVTLPTMGMASNALVARLAIPRLVSARLGPIADQSIRLAGRVLGDATIGGVHGYVISDGPQRLENAASWAVGGAVVPVLGTATRLAGNAVTGGKYLQYASQSFERRISDKLIRTGMNKDVAGMVAKSFDDLHRRNWAVMGNGNLGIAAESPHIMDRMVQDVVRKSMNLTDDAAVREAADALLRQSQMRRDAVKSRLRFDKEMEKDLKVTDADLVFGAVLPGGIPDPKAIKGALEKFIGTGKTIDRKRYQGLLKYLQRAESGLPHVQDMYSASLNYLKGNAAGTDALKQVIAELEQAGPLTQQAVYKELKKHITDFKASSKAVRKVLSESRKQKLQDANDILAQAKQEFATEPKAVQEWVRRDPMERWASLSDDLQSELDDVAPRHVQATAARRPEAAKTHRETGNIVTRFREKLATAETKLAEATERQTKEITGKIREAEDRLARVKSNGLADRVQQTLETELEYLTAERDVAIRAAFDGTQPILNKLNGIRARAKKPGVQYRVNDAVQQTLDDRKRWVAWVEEQYEAAVEILKSPAVRKDIEEGLSTTVSSDSKHAAVTKQLEGRVASLEAKFADAPKSKKLPLKIAAAKDAVAKHKAAKRLTPIEEDIRAAQAAVDAEKARLEEVAGKMRERFGKKVDEWQAGLAKAERAHAAASDDLIAIDTALKEYGDPHVLGRRARDVHKKYDDRIADALKRAEKEVAEERGAHPLGADGQPITAARGRALRKGWHDAKRAAATIRRDAHQAFSDGEAAILDAQNSLLRAATAKLDEGVALGAKVEEIIGGARSASQRQGVLIADTILDEVAPLAGGHNIFGKVSTGEQGLRLAKIVDDEVRAGYRAKAMKVARAFSNAVTGADPDVRVGRIRPSVFLRLAERVAGVQPGRFRGLGDVPIGVIDRMHEVFVRDLQAPFQKQRDLAFRDAVIDASRYIDEAVGRGAAVDGIDMLTPEVIKGIERNHHLPPGVFTETPLNAVPPKYRKGLEEALGLKKGSLTRASVDLSVTGLEAIEKANGLEAGSLTTAAGKLKLINAIAKRQVDLRTKFRTAGMAEKFKMLEGGDVAVLLAGRHGHAFSDGAIMARAAEMGATDLTEALAPGKVRNDAIMSIMRSVVDEARTGFRTQGNGALLKGVSEQISRMMHEPFVARAVLHNFMMLDEVLGGMGFDITPLLDDIRRSVVREKMLTEATIDEVSLFTRKMAEIHASVGAPTGKSGAMARREANELVTDFQLASSGGDGVRYTMDEVLDKADELGIQHSALAEAAKAADDAYEAYHNFLIDSGYEVRKVGGYVPKKDMAVPDVSAPKGVLQRILKRPTDGFLKERSAMERPIREYDSMVLLSGYNDDVMREHLMGEATRHAARIEEALRDLTASSDNKAPRLLQTFSDVVNYAKGVNRTRVVDLGIPLPGGGRIPITLPLYRWGYRRHALMLSSPKTAIRQLGDPFIVMSKVAPANKLASYNKTIWNNRNLKKMDPERFERIKGYLDADGIGGGEYKIWDSIGLQHGELMSAAKNGTPLEGTPPIDKVISKSLGLLHGVDSWGRITAAATGEDIAEAALKTIPKGLPPHEAFRAFEKEMGSRILSRGQWDFLYPKFFDAYTKGETKALFEESGKKVSQTLLFDFFPGSGSSITRNPYLRAAVPFYSWVGSNTMLMLRTLGRNEGVGSVAVSAIMEGVGLAARYGAGPGLEREAALLGGLSSYIDLVYDPLRPVYDKDATPLRATSEVVLGPGVGGIVNLSAQIARTIGVVWRMSTADMDQVLEVAAAGQKFKNAKRRTVGDEMNAEAKRIAGQLGNDAYEVLVRSIGMVNWASGVVEGATDDRWALGDLAKGRGWFSGATTERAYDNELTFYQLVSFYFIQSGGKPISPLGKEDLREDFRVEGVADGSIGSNLSLVNEAFWKAAGRKAVRGQGVISDAARP